MDKGICTCIPESDHPTGGLYLRVVSPGGGGGGGTDSLSVGIPTV